MALDDALEFKYQMLGRLIRDCKYYLGYGNKKPKHLWAGDEIKHIEEMKKIYNSFTEDEKPKETPYEQILEYEKQMVCK
ncbi:hypothetical protein CN918_25700 [Priestia megaterium]|nr:hypothetical protein CN918_25700 [Priestia megaterium]